MQKPVEEKIILARLSILVGTKGISNMNVIVKAGYIANIRPIVIVVRSYSASRMAKIGSMMKKWQEARPPASTANTNRVEFISLQYVTF